MRVCFSLALIALSVLVFSTTSSATVITYTGSLSSQDGGISGTGMWVDPNEESPSKRDDWVPVELTWTVTDNTDGTWHYDYLLEVYRKEVSHLILEVSDSFTTQELLDPVGPFQQAEIGTFTPDQGNSNPGMPGSLYGIKFDSACGTSVHITFDSPRAPTWGDFYAKSGNGNAAWSSAFLLPDPTEPPQQGDYQGKILVPDTLGSVPEPATLALLFVGGMALASRKARRGRVA